MQYDNYTWRNFIIPVDENRYVSMGQWYNEETGDVHSHEVALFVNNSMVGDPVTFKFYDGFDEIMRSIVDDDYTLFQRQYVVELDLFDNDNSAGQQ